MDKGDGRADQGGSALKWGLAAALVAVLLAGGIWLGRGERLVEQQAPDEAEVTFPSVPRGSSGEFAAVSDQVPETAATAPDVQEEVLPPGLSQAGKSIEDAREAMGRRAYDKAAEALMQALAKETDPEKKQQIRVMLAESLSASQDFDGAAAVYREYLAGATSDEERVLAVTRLAGVLSLQKRFDEAEALLANPGLIGDDPAQRQAIQYAQLRLWQSRPGRLDEVAAELEGKIAADPADRESLDLLGTIYLRVQRDSEKAKPVYEKMLAQDPDNPGLQNTLIGIYQETRDYAKARDIYERYLEHHPDQADGIRYQIAALYVQSGQGDDAVAYAEQYLAGAEATVDQREMAARIFEFANRLDDAAHVLKAAESAAPTDEKRVDLQFRQVDLLSRQDKYAEAEALVRRILADHGNDREIRARANQELIRLYQVQGRVGELEL